jgi:hypothetical protein
LLSKAPASRSVANAGPCPQAIDRYFVALTRARRAPARRAWSAARPARAAWAALRLLTDVADSILVISVWGDDGARAVGATDDARSKAASKVSISLSRPYSFSGIGLPERTAAQRTTADQTKPGLSLLALRRRRSS